MRVYLELREAKRGFNCPRCGSRTRACEKFLAVVNLMTGRQIERSCVHCEPIVIDDLEYNGDTIVPAPSDGEDEDFRIMNAAERQAETYAAYRMSGCESAYWTDRDAGYCD